MGERKVVSLRYFKLRNFDFRPGKQGLSLGLQITVYFPVLVFIVDVCSFTVGRVLQSQHPKYFIGLGHLCAKDLVNIENINKGMLRIKQVFEIST